MECNRDEALRVKDIAERKFLVKDFKGAKKFALKAKNLYPELEGISQMLMTLDVYVSAEEDRVPGESNWYGVLGVNPLSDDETIRKQYRKLALLLHPDKNRSIGAEGAFQLISQAWSLLSDKSKKMAYDRSCGEKFQHKSQPKYCPSGERSGFYDLVKKTASAEVRAPKKASSSSKRDHSSVRYSSDRQENETFWTVCHRCKMQYEYLRMYLNYNLLCPNCHEAYFATEIDPPSNRDSKTLFQNSGFRKRKSKHLGSGDAGFNGGNNSNHSDFQWVPFSKSSGGAHSAVQAANMVQQAFEKVKRERQKAQASARKQEALLRKNLSSKRMKPESSSHMNGSKRFKAAEECSMNKETIKFPGSEKDHNSKQDVKPHLDFKQLLMEKARAEICEKLNTGISNTRGVGNATIEKIHVNTQEKESLDSTGPCLERKFVEEVSMHVPDSDFYDFDTSRRVESFGSNQVWAVYDDEDGMPRHYAMIHEVISPEPFRVRLSWLIPVTHSRVSHVSWYTNGSSKTCGTFQFQLGKHEIVNSVDCFSHNVRRWKKGCASNTILIYPQKGDIWAFYRNWSPEWDELTEYEMVHKYDIVEVLEDHDEEFGVIVIPLVKAAGSKAIFRHHFDSSQIRRIPSEEISRFSHQVPSNTFTGEQGLNLLRGFRELDPAAVPSEILKAASSLNLEINESMDCDCVEEVEPCKDTNNKNVVEGVSCEVVKPVDQAYGKHGFENGRTRFLSCGLFQ